MKLVKKIFSIIILSIAILLVSVHLSNAQTPDCTNPSSLSLDQINTCLDTLNQAKNESEKATKPLEDQVNAISQRVNFIERDVANKEKSINDGYKNLEREQQILNQTIRDYYIKSYYNSPLLILLTAKSAQELTQILGYQKATADRDKAIITSIVISVTTLEQRKKVLEDEKANIVIVKEKLSKVVTDAKAYQAKLSSQISSLSAVQKSLLAQRLASLNIPLYAYNTQGGCSSDISPFKSPGFSPALGFFSYGVPNRVGLNQYGAKKRAENGQSAEDILSAYYNNVSFDTVSTSTNIHVVGSNEYGQSFDTNWDIETYVKHIYEMPTNWDIKALRAQAIAARSYALSYTNNGSGSICPSQSCQVVKQEQNSDAWVQAVNDTAGKVMTQGGTPIKAWFSSTHGGYVHSSGDIGWSDTGWTKNAQDASGSINSFSDLNNNAYDKDSPWFYCDWGSRSDYNKTAWLKSEEVADMANVMLLVQADSSTKEHLYQPDKPNPAGTETWNADKVKSELRNRNQTPFNSVSSVSVSADFGSGKTTNVTINGDAGSKSFSGDFFKTYFNLRAPSNIQIVGPLYNVEQR